MENGFDDEVGRAAETTAASGGSVRASASGPPAVFGRLLLLDPGRPSRAKSETKLNVLAEKPRKDCDCEVDEGEARKDWLGSRKEWLFVGLELARSMSEL